MTHLDLFSGIGGFSLASDTIWGDVEHVFVEIDPFCQEVLKKHWPESKLYGDIRQFITDTQEQNDWRRNAQASDGQEPESRNSDSPDTFLLTGGFPCQPFSQAGQRRGTSDDRYLWPEMFTLIQLYRPQWVIAENVRGLASWNDGMVLEQVCTDLENEGYQVQPIIIPACAKDAPHERKRVWIVFHADSVNAAGIERPIGENFQVEKWAATQSEQERNYRFVELEPRAITPRPTTYAGALRILDGIPNRVDRCKSLGNAIVPQVAYEILRCIRSV
jgi:DNA (cytosine-5)-methyltransferase 1